MSKEKLENKTQVIVVGGGPAGICAAIQSAKSGVETILIERGDFCGSKNMFGGAIYTKPVKKYFPNFEKEAPLERLNIEHRYALLTENEATVIAHRTANAQGYSVIRAKFDRWMAEKAKEAGVIVVTNTVVRELIKKNNKVVGIKTDLEEYYADIVIIADGANSLLAKQIGLRNSFEKTDMALGVKEVYKLPPQTINERFNLEGNQGCTYMIMGGSMIGALGLGYIYTNKDSITIGLGITLDELEKKTPYEYLDELKLHPSIAPLIKDGEMIEYTAHLIPEGGYKKIPKLFTDGALVVGDAAMLVNNLHWEGTNLAMESGSLAGLCAANAVKTGDTSIKELRKYKKMLENSYVIKDMKAYKNLMDIMHSRKSSFLKYYPEKISEFFNTFGDVDEIPKRNKFRKFITDFVTGRCICELFKDLTAVLRILWGLLK